MLSTIYSIRHRLGSALAAVVGAAFLAGCIFRIDIEQGNLLEDSAIEQVQVGMTRSQVRFLLGTPMIADSFHQDRWDYTYYLQPGKSRDVERRWLIVYFEEDEVTRIVKDALINPRS